jgi:AraC-like DNA-binding protein
VIIQSIIGQDQPGVLVVSRDWTTDSDKPTANIRRLSPRPTVCLARDMPAAHVAPLPAGLVAQFDIDGASLSLPVERLFDDLPNVVFFLKDRAGAYLAVNRTLAERCGRNDKAALIGKRPSDFYPSALASNYERQDQRVLQTGRATLDQLELQLYPDRKRGWCLTSKYPVPDRRTGAVVALMGISRDLEESPSGMKARGFPEFAVALEAMRARVADPPRIDELAALCNLSISHFSRLVHRVFHLTPRQLAMKVRLDEALHLLSTTDLALAEIAQATGFCDQSAFTRHFRRFVGLPPGTYRSLTSTPPGARS